MFKARGRLTCQQYNRSIERFDKVIWLLRTAYLLIIICALAAGLTRYAFADFDVRWFAHADDHGISLDVKQGIAKSATADSRWASACFLIFTCGNRKSADTRPATNAGPQKNAAADRVEELYNGSTVGTDAAGNEGYNAAQRAEEQLRLDFLNSFQNPQTNAANQTPWDQEEAQLISDSLKYGGDRTLDAAAMYWGETNLNLPVLSPEELLAQAETMQVSDQPGEREFDAFMANYLAMRFDSLSKLASYYQTATNDIDGVHVPLDLADLQAELRTDEVDRTIGKPKPF